MLVVVCGVSGVGKSTIGKLLAEKLQIAFYDADDFHPQSNVKKMVSGQALTDEDRKPWLNSLAKKLPEWDQQGGAVLACSALKEFYRKALSSFCYQGENIQWVILSATEALLRERLGGRKGHFFDGSLLHTQFQDLELPEYGCIVDVTASPEETVAEIIEKLCI